MQLLDDARAGKQRALARLISLVEGGGPTAARVLAALYPHTGGAYVIGVTGPPGAGKSTLVNELALEYLRRGVERLAILAVDPSSPFGGGAILGDRIRMQALAGNPAIFVRSMASRGQLGGLARTTGDAIRVLDAAGFPLVIIETVGAGQAEVAVAREADTTVVVEVPGLGDDIQAIKAGILEIADLLVVNKADRDGAEQTRRHLEAMLHLGSLPTDGWRVPVLMAVATRGDGIPALADVIARHRQHLEGSDRRRGQERERLVRELQLRVQEQALALVEQRVPPETRDAIIERMARRELDPLAAAELLLEALMAGADVMKDE
jgi:LAO/AO transport system kinase